VTEHTHTAGSRAKHKIGDHKQGLVGMFVSVVPGLLGDQSNPLHPGSLSPIIAFFFTLPFALSKKSVRGLTQRE